MLQKFHLTLNKKTELVVFKNKIKKIECLVKIKLICKRLCSFMSVRYLSTKIDENINWKSQSHDIATKLNKSNALLCMLVLIIFKQFTL